MTNTWSLAGTYVESCNCETACPCVFLSEPTEDDCTVLVGWHIDDGHADGIDLDGLNVALAVHSPGHMAQVPWTVALYLDERADGKQSDALTRIFTGQAGGHPARLAGHIGDVLGISSVAIEFTADGRRHSLSIGEVGSAEFEAIEGQQGEPVNAVRPSSGDRSGSPGRGGAVDPAQLPRPRARLGTVRQERVLLTVLLPGMTAMSALVTRRRVDTAAVLAGLAGITAVAWVLTVRFASGMSMPTGTMAMDAGMPMSAGLAITTAMWIAMMVGMMVPSATPMVLAYSDGTRRGSVRGSRTSAITAFVSGYVLVWAAFSLLAALLQVALTGVGERTPMGAASRPVVGAAVLVLAGLFQLTRWKDSCLRGCRTPVAFLIAEWRDGARGGLIMGLRHGAYCLGCCAALMAVLFVVGTMHLVGMVAMTGFVLVEKVAPSALPVRYVSAAGLVGWGAAVLVRAVPS